jgi:TRAP transporter TAXI family solute receptor
MTRYAIAPLLVLALTAMPVHGQKQQLNLALAGAGSAAFVYGGGLADYLSKTSTKLNVSAQASQGFSANVRLVNAGSVALGFSAAPTFYEALRGIGEFKEKHPNIRAVHPIWPAELHCVAFRDKGIRSEADLAGKRISVGLKATSGAVVAETLLKEAGLADKATVVYLNPSQSVDAMRDGKIDVMCANSGGPYPAFVGLTGGGGLALIPWRDETLKKGAAATPGRTVKVIPKGTYTWQTGDAPSLGHWSFMFANKDVPDAMVSELLTVWLTDEARAHLLKVGDGWKELPKEPLVEVLQGIGLPMHPGAVRYWADRGVKLPDIKNAALE